MRCLTVILLVFLANFVCLGNKVNKNLVTKVDSLGNELQKSKDSISSLTKELTVLKADLEKVKTRSEAFDESVWEYGSSLVGIILSVTVLFGLFYYMSSQQANEQAKQAASDAFVDNFDVYKSMIKEKYKEASSICDRLDSKVDIIDESEIKIKDSLNNITNEFNS